MAIQKRKKYAVVNKEQCVGCGSCMKVCRRNAIHVPKGIFAEIDLVKCVGCGICVKTCPASVIQIETVLLENKEDEVNAG